MEASHVAMPSTAHVCDHCPHALPSQGKQTTSPLLRRWPWLKAALAGVLPWPRSLQQDTLSVPGSGARHAADLSWLPLWLGKVSTAPQVAIARTVRCLNMHVLSTARCERSTCFIIPGSLAAPRPCAAAQQKDAVGCNHTGGLPIGRHSTTRERPSELHVAVLREAA